MAILQDKDLEAASLYSMTTGNAAGTYLLSVLTENHFNYPPTRTAFRRLVTVLRSKTAVLNWKTLCSDPTIDEGYRKMLLRLDVEDELIPKTETQAHHVFNNLDNYRKARIIKTMTEDALETLGGASFDADEILDNISNELVLARMGSSDKPVYHLGRGNNTSKLFKHLIDQSVEVPLIKTGLSTFDEISGGFPENGLVILAAPTSCGKSTVAAQVGINMYTKMKSVAIVTLEMTEEEQLGRTMSSLSMVPFDRVIKRQLNERELTKMKKSYARHVEYGKKNKCRFSLLSPDEDMTLTQILMSLKPFGYDVIIVDYIGLLKGANTDKQWQAMSSIARDAKMYARNTNTLMIMLAQLDNEKDDVRYSKGIKEHADNVWFWGIKEADRESKKFKIRQVKGRNAPVMNFDVNFDFGIMRVWDQGKSANVDMLEITKSASKDDPYRKKDGALKEKRKRDADVTVHVKEDDGDDLTQPGVFSDSEFET